jgi:DNA repair exonuclease SbcCD ATPase subunit
MFEDYSRNRRFVGWLEKVAEDTRSVYPEPASFADDAKSFLTRFDRMRSDQRTLEKCYRELLSGLGELAEVPPQAQPTQVLDALNAKLASAEETGSRQTLELESELQTTRESLEAARAELETTQAELAETRAEIQREQRKLDPVLRYAYNLRRLVQKIYAKGELTPSIRNYIEELLEAGGASVNVGTQRTAPTRSTNSTSTIT